MKSRLPCWPRLLALLALWALSPARAAEEGIRLGARLDPEVIGLDELAVLTVEVATDGFASLPARPVAFTLENLEIAGGPSRGENFRFVNGAASRSVTFRWHLRPMAVGPAAVRSLAVDLGGARRPLPDLAARVEAEAPPGRAAPAPSPNDLFGGLFPDPFGRREEPRSGPPPKVRLQAAVEPANAWVGQQVVYTLHLLTQADVHSLRPREMPEVRGAWVRELTVPERPQPEWVTVDGERYGRVPLVRRALFPLGPGRLEIPSAAIDVVVNVAELARFGAPFGRPTELRRQSGPVVVEVRPLPVAPGDFSGAVGDLRLAARLDPPRVDVGEAATLTLTLTGSGNPRALPDPALAVPDGVRRFAPQSRSEEREIGGRLVSERSWSYVLVPEAGGSHRLPGVEVAYFDPTTASFRRASSPPLTLLARPKSNRPAAVPPTDPTPSAPPPVRDRREAAPPESPSLWPWAAALGLLAGAAVLAWSRLRSPRRRARRHLLSRLAAARLESRPRQAAGLIEDAWRDYLGERWELPAGIALSGWAEQLAARGVDAEVAGQLVAYLQDVHQLRFAPQLAATDALVDDLVARSRALARAVG